MSSSERLASSPIRQPAAVRAYRQPDTATPTWPGLEPTSVTHGTILHNSMYRFDDQTAAFGLPAEDVGSRDDALLCLNMPSCPAHRPAGAVAATLRTVLTG
jgi:hypothetical protein